MQVPRNICLTLSNDLHHDQRMIRICGTLARAGYQVTLIGRQWPDKNLPKQREFRQLRLACIFNKGKLFYLEYNIRLFFKLLCMKMDIVCAVDLDTIMPCYLASVIKRIPRVHDAHEFFTEMKEVVTRPGVRRIWLSVERFAIPRFPMGYTVSKPIADHFRKTYGVSYQVIRNLPAPRPFPDRHARERIILYQGAVNEGRCFEWLIPAMRNVDAELHIYGDGNFMTRARSLIRSHGLEDKVMLKGKVLPEKLHEITTTATIGISLFEDTGMHNRFSLANRFFDFIQAGIPQICSDFPAYREINDEYRVALMTNACNTVDITDALNNLLGNELMYMEMRENCRRAARVLHWHNEEKTLLDFYKNI